MWQVAVGLRADRSFLRPRTPPSLPAVRSQSVHECMSTNNLRVHISLRTSLLDAAADGDDDHDDAMVSGQLTVSADIN